MKKVVVEGTDLLLDVHVPGRNFMCQQGIKDMMSLKMIDVNARLGSRRGLSSAFVLMPAELYCDSLMIVVAIAKIKFLNNSAECTFMNAVARYGNIVNDVA